MTGSDDESENSADAALTEQFMMSTSKYISMGGGKDGTNGLRLNEDLTRGSSGNSVTYNNKPLFAEILDMLAQNMLKPITGFTSFRIRNLSFFGYQ